MGDFNTELLDFIEKSPDSYHAADTAAHMLAQAGFQALREDERWHLQAGGRYYVIRNDSALIALEIPEGEFEGLRICASHSDSPYFKIKENPQISRHGYVVWNVEKYGGMLLAPWFDRPLGVAGRLCLQRPEGIETRLVDFQKDMAVIPSLAIHMDRNANEGVKWNVQEHMLPLYGLDMSGDVRDEKSCACSSDPDGARGDSAGEKTGEARAESLMEKAAVLAGISPNDILASDLFVYNRQRGSIWGASGEFISAPRLDDLQCAFACLKGFLAGGRKEHLCIYALLDNEEVGSSTRQGAASTFLKDTLHRVYQSLGRDFEQYQIDLAKGLMLSADNAHAVHPGYAGKADPVNRPVIGGGVVLKFSGNQKYCTDAYSAALFRRLCQEAGCSLQVFTNRSDMLGGSTLGNISNNQVAIPTADIGLPQLAMHSSYETAGTRDGEDLLKIAHCFYA